MAAQISVVTPCFNAAPYIAETVESVQRQTWCAVEHIVVDDGSTDGSREILSELASVQNNLRIVLGDHVGPSIARNIGIEQATGEFIAFLDADDWWDPRCLEALVTALQGSGASLAYCGWQNSGLEGARGEPFVPPDYADVDRVELLLGGNRWPIHAALTRTHVVRAAGGFDKDLTSCMDYDLWLRIGSTHDVTLVPEVLAYYRHHQGEQITKNRARGAINHWKVQQKFLEAHPDVAQRLGRRVVRDLTLGELMRRGFQAYWARDLVSARTIFRSVMAAGYGALSYWKYMLPSYLPLGVHRALVKVLGRH
ncbi:MAG: glycosyltransferase [Pseudomonadota bacterium]